MSPTLAPADRAWSYETDDDRRSHCRYPIILEVEYKLLKRGHASRSGSGTTTNISSGGVLFETNERLPSSGPIELALKWPFLLNGGCPLKLVIQGRIVRKAGNQIAVWIKHHEFHTAGSGIQKADYSRGF